MLAVTLLLALLAVLPSLWPAYFPGLSPVVVDTDPENMLSKDEAARVFHNDMKRVFSLNDIVVVGVVNETDPNGVFTPRSLRDIYELTEYALTLKGESIGQDDPQAGVIDADVIAPSTVDNIEQGGPGVVKFEWLMPKPPESEAEALAIREKARRIPFLDGTLLSENGKALCIYLPITAKDLSYKIYSKLRARIAEFDGDERFFITGLPVANDTFGVEMFVQMAISAPLAMLVIFLLMLLFFRKLTLIIAPMIIAMVSVICTMALLVIMGNTIHIMSSMIPIFIMPIAVLNSIHILSEFFERYQDTKDRRQTIIQAMDTLFTPMLYTSLTTMAGFASLALAPIPPVQIFGLFVAFGILLAWFLTITFIPAYVMFLSDRRLENFGVAGVHEDEAAGAKTLMGRLLRGLGNVAYHHAKLVVVLTAVVALIAVYGITKIEINDNPIKWFKKSHDIRVADHVLNKHFGGTYMAYLSLRAAGERSESDGESVEPTPPGPETAEPALPTGLDGASSEPALPSGLGASSEPELPAGLGGATSEPVQAVVAPERSPAPPDIFKEPEVLRYISGLQEHLLTTGVVGKSNSLSDIVKTVHRELIDGSDAQFRIPDTRAAVAQCLMQFESSHRPGDLWHFVTPDFDTTSIWVQLKSGDNKDMSRVVAAINDYVAAHPATFTVDAQEGPIALEHGWFGLTYINIVWQEKMVTGMVQAFLGSFFVVLLMMIILFRSGLWGILSMIPLTVTIGLIYGVIGIVGKDYDMPVAILSSMTLGLAVDFAIHFLVRGRVLYDIYGTWEKTYSHVFGEPARAITRNIIVIAVGFTPLLFAPLVPYVTVGVFLAAILFVSGVATLVILPALVRLLEPLLYPETRVCCVTCQCGTCIISAVTAVLLVALNVHQFLSIGWTTLSWVSLAVLPVLAFFCVLMSRREQCRIEHE